MSRIIHTRKGQGIIVNDEDYEGLNEYLWEVLKGRSTYYAVRSAPAMTRMHRVIMNAKKGQLVDHINGNGLDNKKENLRICTNTENARNQRTRRNNTSGYKGVTWNKRNGKWHAQIMVDGKNSSLGLYPLREDAARAYNVAALERFGEFAKINEGVEA